MTRRKRSSRGVLPSTRREAVEAALESAGDADEPEFIAELILQLGLVRASSPVPPADLAERGPGLRMLDAFRSAILAMGEQQRLLVEARRRGGAAS